MQGCVLCSLLDPENCFENENITNLDGRPRQDITVHGQRPNYLLDGQTFEFEFESENRVYLCKSSEIYHPRYRADPLLLSANCPHQPGTKPTPNWKNWQRNTATTATTTATPAASLTETSPGNLLEFKVASFYWFW